MHCLAFHEDSVYCMHKASAKRFRCINYGASSKAVEFNGTYSDVLQLDGGEEFAAVLHIAAIKNELNLWNRQ